MKGRRKTKRHFTKKRKDFLISLLIIFLLINFCLIILPLLLIALLNPDGSNSGTHDYVSVQVNVYRHVSGKTISLDLEDYVAGVVAGEMPASFEIEALKAQAVAARTYAVSKITRAAEGGNSKDHPAAPLCDDTHCQVYRSENELLELKGDYWMADGWQKIQEAVNSTRGQVMYYQGDFVEQPLFHSASGGQTENSEDVFVSALPYLRSVESLYEGNAPHQNEAVSVSLSTFIKKVSDTYGASSVSTSTIKILSRSEGGRVDQIQVGDKTLSGRNIRDLFGLRSANFTLAFDGNENIVFTTKGFGHGVGMSQWGANGMAQAGYDYKEILQHYYSGTSIDVLKSLS